MALAAKCCLCSDEFSSIDDLEAHISADHFNCLPFECEKCKFAKFPTEFAIKRHYEEDHGLVEYFVRYRVSREIYEKKQKVRECLERCVCHTAEIVGVPHQQQQGQISVSGKSVAVPVEYANHNHHHHQYTHQLHEGEFLSPSSTSKVRVSAANTELFQSSRPRTSSISGTNQSDLIGTDIGGPTDHDPGFDQSNLMGNLLEHIKTDMDGTTLSHFDQMYASDMTSGSEQTRGIDRIIVTTTHHHAQEHELDVVGHKPQHGQIGMGSTPHMASTNTTVVVGKSQNGINGTQIVAQHHVPASSHHSTPGVRTTRPSELPCQVCKQMVVNRSTSLMYHVNVKHLKLALFKCKNCGEEFLWNRPAANRHAKRHGGDESMIENNTEKLFPILNKHRREYFNLAPPLRRTSTSPSQQDQLMEQSATTGEQDANNEAMEEDEGNEVKKEGGNEPGKEDESTPNAILAQLVDMTRSGSQGEEAGSSQQQNTSTASSSAQQQEEGGGTIGKQKTIKCGGCGDMVINQEWILLNHVNTKHLHLPLYKCVSCDKPFENYLRSYAVRHAKFYHAGDESLLLDQRDQFWSGLREACSRLFGLTKVGE